MKHIAAMILVFAWMGLANADLQEEIIEYKHGDTILEGYLVYDDSIEGKRPAVLVVHEWKGMGSYEKMRAKQLANLGYVAFALDMYGKGIRPETREEAAKQATTYRSDRQLMRERANAGLKTLRQHKLTDPRHIAAIGYCFGGGVVLELARSGADIPGVVSFHGNLDTPDPTDANNIKAKVLVLHGADDPHVPEAHVTAFKDEMSTAGVDWQMVLYGGAVHSFTNPAAGTDPSAGAAYNEHADRRSWAIMKLFFEEIFGS